MEALKWVALASMLLDHIGRLALGYGQATWVFAGGRLAFPLFAIVLGLNLARTGDRAERSARTTLRLAFWCAVSVGPSVWARGHPEVVNVLGTLGLGALLCWLAEAHLHAIVRLTLAVPVIVAAPHVEFGLPGVLLVFAVYAAATRPGIATVVAAAASLLLTGWLNARHGGWAAMAGTLGALPLLVLVRGLPLRVSRLGRAFYIVYPAHLALIAAWQALGAGR